ncbi:hypothetical protein [Gramella sp. AN32]|uniref:Uncharacterized protein n=1 Tax=Christiangramia antarctica TaxID=2058158 RepID=A0ABW5X8S5_9FLAO|nr:hypothetical protein [Gramella sp. AN32]MCM4155991.1 hypothetical protein [Gramella sp. AN32]
MRNITANAILNLKEQPETLYVHGSIMTYRADDIIEINVASPQGINPSILVLDLKVQPGNGPMKGTPKPFNLQLSEDSAKNFSQVTIRYSEDASVTVNVEIFG